MIPPDVSQKKSHVLWPKSSIDETSLRCMLLVCLFFRYEDGNSVLSCQQKRVKSDTDLLTFCDRSAVK